MNNNKTMKLLLNDGNYLPVVGLGTYKSTEQEGANAVEYALRKGYRLIDTAAVYKNEEAVGKGIKASGIPREEIVLTSKLWRDCLGYKSAKKEFHKSLERLNVDYIDLYLVHWPANAKNYNNWKQTNADTWRALEELQAEGKIKSIGVSNFWQEHLEALFKTARVIPAVNQIEFHPGYWQPELVKFCQAYKIVIEAWSPLARGRVFDNELLQQIAKKYKQSIAKVCLRWIVQHQVVVLPKSNTKNRIDENIDFFDFELSEEEMAQINNLPEMGFSGELPNIWPDRLQQA